jgi:cytochrome c oxidase subunit II
MDNKLYVLFILAIFAVFIVGCTADQPGPGPAMTDNTGDSGSASGTVETGSGVDDGPAGAGTTDNADNGEADSGDDSGSADGSTGEVKVITIDSYDFGFTVDAPTINKGDRVKVVVTSSSGIHGVAIPDFGVDIKPVGVGEEKSAEFVADKSGLFTYFCNVPCGSGHKSMRGTITVN